jgi:RNA polymerase sigma-70 factor, ECF subfamily
VTSNDPRSDLELIAALNKGDAGAFDGLYYRYRDWVHRLAYRFAQNDQDALDVLQETFAYLARKFPGFKLTAAMTTFLYPVVKNSAIAIRRKKRREPALDPASVPEAAAPDDAARGGEGDLERLMGRLPDQQRDVLLMRFVDGLALEEIAQILGVPLGTVKSRLHNALATLREDPNVRRYFEPV